MLQHLQHLQHLQQVGKRNAKEDFLYSNVYDAGDVLDCQLSKAESMMERGEEPIPIAHCRLCPHPARSHFSTMSE